jgi:hypothetical protein
LETLVAELARRGKLLVGDPFFEPGTPVVVDRKGVREEISLSYIDPDAVARGSKGSSDELITSTRFSKGWCGTRA